MARRFGRLCCDGIDSGADEKMKAMKRITLIAVCVSLFYIALSVGISFTELFLRTWVKALGQMIVGLITPGMILFLALCYLYGNERVHDAVRLVCTIAAVIVGGIYAFFIFLFILLGMEEEQMLTSHLLVTNEAFLSETNPVYYRPVAFLFKRPGELTAADQLEYLEKKYKRAFEISKSGNKIYDVALPEIRVSVVPDGMSLVDNYMEEVTFHFLLEVYRAEEMEREYHIIETGKRKYLCLEAFGYDDIPALAEDVSCLVDGVLSGGKSASEYIKGLYQEHIRGLVYFSFGEEGYAGSVSFGGKDREWPIDVEAIVRTAYSKYGSEELKESQELYQYTGEEDSVSEGDEAALEPETEPELATDYREVAARAVYDSVLSEEGFSYEVCYNAKGNLYIDLGTKTVEEDDKVYSYRLVYDRPSKNGACELLVLYWSVEGSDNEAIVDMYAVETATGKVVASGRKAWSDVGMKEYREMTGE